MSRLIEKISSTENSNPRDVPRYHSRLTKFTSTRSMSGVRNTRRTKNKSRTRLNAHASTMPARAIAGTTTHPKSNLVGISVEENIGARYAGPARANALKYAITPGFVCLPQARVTPGIIDDDDPTGVDAMLGPLKTDWTHLGPFFTSVHDDHIQR